MTITKKMPKKVAGDSQMTLKEANIRYNLLNILAEPKNCAKIDVHLYKNEAGRINFWYKNEENSNLNINSYYFTCKNDVLIVYNDVGVVVSVPI